MMRFGVVVGICTDRGEDQRRSIESIAEFSAHTTQLVALFNGVDPFPIHARYEVLHEPSLIGREQGLWRRAFDLAVAREWDWCGTFHDDFYLYDPGWEAAIRRMALTHKIGITSYACYRYAAACRAGHEYSVVTGLEPGAPVAPQGFLGTVIDGCGMAFNMRLFKRRGTFTCLNVMCGFGELEAGFWALSQGWGCGQIQGLRATHHPENTSNTREVLKIGADGVSEAVRWHLDILPAAVVDEDRIKLADRMINVRRGSEPITVLRPSYGPDEEAAVLRVLRRAWSGSGPETEAFEAEFAAYLGVQPEHVISTSSCTSALYLALKAQGWPAGSQVIVSPLTFVSTVAAIREAGCEPVFVDVEEESLTIDADRVRAAIVPGSTRGILVVHLAGVPADMERLCDIAAREGVVIVEDCAHAAGSGVNGVSLGLGPHTAASCWSFNALKNIGAGDGGAVVAGDEAVARRLRAARWCGIDKDTFARAGTAAPYSWQYDIVDVSLKHQMNELSAAVARVQLTRLAAMNARRGEVAAAYRAGLGGLSWVKLPASPASNVVYSNHLFMIRVPATDRDRLIDFLRSVSIGTSVHYKPINLHAPYMRGSETHEGMITPVAHRVWRELVSLPMHAGLTDDDIERVIDAVSAFEPTSP